MARGRILSRAVADDAALNRLSADAERLYLRSLPHLDRDGLLDGRPVLLWATVAPLRPELQDPTPALIDEWVSQGMVLRYQGADGPVLFFRGFRRHNQGIVYAKEQPSRFPPPPGWFRTEEGLVPKDPDLARAMAEGFDARSKYRLQLMEIAGSDQVNTSSLPGGYEDQDQVQHQHQQFDDDGGGPGSRTGDADGGLLRAWCRDMAHDWLPEWLGSTARVETADARQLVALSTWLWAWRCLGEGRGASGGGRDYSLDYAGERFRARHRDLFEGVQNVPGRIIRQALDLGNPYPLDEEARAALRAAIGRYADPSAILWGDDHDH